MIETYKLTEEDVANAHDYVPLFVKMKFIGDVSTRCFDTLDITASNGNGAHTNPLPPCYKVNTDRKSRYLMAAFVALYLGKDFKREQEKTEENPNPDNWLMAIDEYDFYAGGHIFEQLNRMKNNTEIRDKCFDIQADYSDLKYRLESDIKGLLAAMNDSASRILAHIEASATPEALKAAMESMNKNQEELDQYIAEHNGSLQKALEQLETELPDTEGE